MLRRCKFDDAEAFALRFNLDVQLVYKERIKYCMQLADPWSSSSNGINLFDEFIEVLNKIKDTEFVCEVCLNAVTVDFTKTQALLDYARDRLKKGDVKVSCISNI